MRDSRGTLLDIYATPGQCHESRAFRVDDGARISTPPPGTPSLARESGGRQGVQLSSDLALAESASNRPSDPTRKDRPKSENFDQTAYRERNIIERVIGWFRENRRLLTRFEKLAVNYVAFWIIAAIVQLL